MVGIGTAVATAPMWTPALATAGAKVVAGLSTIRIPSISLPSTAPISTLPTTKITTPSISIPTTTQIKLPSVSPELKESFKAGIKPVIKWGTIGLGALGVGLGTLWLAGKTVPKVLPEAGAGLGYGLGQFGAGLTYGMAQPWLQPFTTPIGQLSSGLQQAGVPSDLANFISQPWVIIAIIIVIIIILYYLLRR
jgi:hypothetical protein